MLNLSKKLLKATFLKVSMMINLNPNKLRRQKKKQKNNVCLERGSKRPNI